MLNLISEIETTKLVAQKLAFGLKMLKLISEIKPQNIDLYAERDFEIKLGIWLQNQTT